MSTPLDTNIVSDTKAEADLSALPQSPLDMDSHNVRCRHCNRWVGAKKAGVVECPFCHQSFIAFVETK